MKKAVWTLCLAAGLLGCEEKATLSSEKQLLQFILPDVPQAVAEIDQTHHTVDVVIPRPTSLKSLKPELQVSELASVSPASGTAKDFSKPVSYTVTAEDGTAQVYTVNAMYRRTSDKQITSFKLTNYNPDVEGVIDQNAGTILLLLPNKNSIKSLKPTITASDGAIVSPASGTARDFTQPVVYTVTAEDSTRQTYTVTAKNTEKKITAFSFKEFTPDVKGVINQTAMTIEATVPAGTAITALKPSITISQGAVVAPGPELLQDFSKPVTYTVTAEDGKSQSYIVTVKVSP